MNESLMLFTGKGGDCVPDPSKPWIETVASNTGFCIYASRRDGDYTDPGTGYVIPKWEAPFLVARPQPSDARPCRASDPDIGKITGLGEPSVTKDRHLLYFAYIRKLATGTPINGASLSPCDESSMPWKAGETLCRCVEGDPSKSPRGCWLLDCEDPSFDLPGAPDPNPAKGGNCKERCYTGHIDGTDLDSDQTAPPDECLPASILYCADPTKSQSLPGVTPVVNGVDVFEFNIGAARRDDWNASVGVVGAVAP